MSLNNAIKIGRILSYSLTNYMQACRHADKHFTVNSKQLQLQLQFTVKNYSLQ